MPSCRSWTAGIWMMPAQPQRPQAWLTLKPHLRPRYAAQETTWGEPRRCLLQTLRRLRSRPSRARSGAATERQVDLVAPLHKVVLVRLVSLQQYAPGYASDATCARSQHAAMCKQQHDHRKILVHSITAGLLFWAQYDLAIKAGPSADHCLPCMQRGSCRTQLAAPFPHPSGLP